jgi:uncharacterized protein YggU (UPF0235/DUF167 family)
MEDRGAMLEVSVVARAGREQVGPYRDRVLHVRVARPPSGGEANRAVIRAVAAALAVAPSRLVLLAGERARRKRLRVSGLSQAEVEARLAGLGGDGPPA